LPYFLLSIMFIAAAAIVSMATKQTSRPWVGLTEGSISRSCIEASCLCTTRRNETKWFWIDSVRSAFWNRNVSLESYYNKSLSQNKCVTHENVDIPILNTHNERMEYRTHVAKPPVICNLGTKIVLNTLRQKENLYKHKFSYNYPSVRVIISTLRGNCAYFSEVHIISQTVY
jgi:hypothetical protein